MPLEPWFKSFKIIWRLGIDRGPLVIISTYYVYLEVKWLKPPWSAYWIHDFLSILQLHRPFSYSFCKMVSFLKSIAKQIKIVLSTTFNRRWSISGGRRWVLVGGAGGISCMDPMKCCGYKNKSWNIIKSGAVFNLFCTSFVEPIFCLSLLAIMQPV